MLKSYNKGFTLIEILFVIAILSVLASLGLSVLQQRAQQLKVEKTALQMQQILQAGMAFKADSTTSDWPPSCADTDFKTRYLPVNSDNNPWGNAYTCQPTDPDKKKFKVLTTVPSTKIVDQIKALLPNAGATTEAPTIVYTEVSGINTGGTGPTSNIILVGIKNFPLDKASFDANGVAHPSITFTCPSGSTNGRLFFSPGKMQTADAAYTFVNVIANLEFKEDCSTTGQLVVCPVTVYFQTRHKNEVTGILETSSAVTIYNPDQKSGYSQTGLINFQYIEYCTKSS